MSGLGWEMKKGVLVVTPPDYLDFEFKEAIQDLIDDQQTGNQHKILLVMKEVDLMNSHGASALLTLINHVKSKEGYIAFSNLSNPIIEDTFRDIGILWYFETDEHILRCKDVDGAIDQLGDD